MKIVVVALPMMSMRSHVGPYMSNMSAIDVLG
jgi:hypothetical protein